MGAVAPTWNCPECDAEIVEPVRRGPHLSACRRSLNAKYKYFNGDTKHPYEFKACLTCNTKSWIQKRNDYCSQRCSKLGNLNPSSQRDSHHGLTKVEYVRAHELVRRARGNAFGCAHCGTNVQRVYHWANISGDYWNTEDYINLCVPCHDRYDRAKNGFGCLTSS